MRNVTLGHGFATATILAGPIFVTTAWAADPILSGQPVTMASISPAAIIAMPLIALVGAAIALAPVVVGTLTMAALGRSNPGLRHPAIWAMAGAAIVGAWLPWQGDDAISAALTATGAICALLSRLSVRWADGGAVLHAHTPLQPLIFTHPPGSWKAGA